MVVAIAAAISVAVPASSTTTEHTAIIPAGSDVLISQFRVNYSAEREWIEAWNSDGVTTVRVARSLPGSGELVATFFDIQGEGLLAVAANRSSGILDAEIPGLGHLYVEFRCAILGTITPEHSTVGGLYGYEVVSPSGQICPVIGSVTAYLNDRQLVEPGAPVFGRDMSGFSYRTGV